MAGKSESKRGRPRLVDDDTTTDVNVRMPTRDYDRACTKALRESAETGTTVSVSALIRRGLKRVVDDDDDDDDVDA